MITGALLLDPKREVTWQKLCGYVMRMLAVLAIFCPVYACMSARCISLEAIGRGLVQAATYGSWDHLWYVYSLIGLYLLTPILSAYVRGATKAQQRMTLFVLSVPTLLIPTINKATGANLVTFVWVTYVLFYYLLGAYAHQYLSLSDTTAAWGVGSLATAMVGGAAIIVLLGTYPLWIMNPRCPLMVPWSLFVFLAAKRHLEGRPAPGPLALASNLSLAIYLIHPLPLVVLYRRLWWMPYETLPPVIFEIVAFALVLGTTVPVAMLLKRVPGLRRIL